MEKKNYYVGLDIGTNSIGWAVTDPDYNLLHIKRKLAWGVHLFESASTAETRRLYRANRRRLMRRRNRVLLLQSLLQEEIVKADPHFFLRLNSTRYYPEDKDTKIADERFPIFNDKNFTEKDYFKKYPTIYHLQNALIEKTNKKFDLRLIYLAVHHLIKYRGHFVLEHTDLKIDSFSNELVGESFSALNEYFSALNVPHIFTKDNVKKYEKIVNEPLGILTMVKLFKEQFGKLDKVVERALRVAVGGTGKVSDFFPELASEEDFKFSFKDNNFEEEKYFQLLQLLGDNIVLVDNLKKLYDYMIISRLMEGETLFAKAMVNKYETHKKDLAELKKIVKKHLTPEDYYEIFKKYHETRGENYPSYVGMLKIGKKKYRPVKADYDTFTKFIKRKLKNVPEAKKIIDKIDKGIYMPLQTTKENAKIPFQFNEHQLKIILDNQSKFYEFLNVKDKDGLTPAQKIMSILRFKIPYYVGPLVDKGSDFSWVVRKSNDPVKPWNFHEIIDVDQSAEQFILRMTNKCTYLKLEDVLPRESLLYEEFVMLNLLNSVKINNEKIDLELRTKIIEAITEQGQVFTIKSLQKYIKNLNPSFDGEIIITGIDSDAKLGLPTKTKFAQIFGAKAPDREVLEKIIFYATIFEDRKIYGKKVTDLLKEEKLDKRTLHQIRQLTFNGWSRLSKAFLTGYSAYESRAVLTNAETGEVTSIIEVMRENPLNLQEVLYSDTYNLQEALDRYFMSISDDQTLLEEIQSMPLSPSIKRPVYRAMRMLEEIRDLQNGAVPTKVMIETTRGREDKRRGKKVPSRLKQLQELYSAAKKQTEEIKELQVELNTKLTDYDLRPRKLFLYYLQMGKCMYTGKRIDLSQLMTSAYDIDHIIPQSVVKDDSLNNLCLVLKDANMAKGSDYPLNITVVDKMKPFWRTLLSNNMMTKEKYERLTRIKPLTDEEYTSFINRQLVEVSQATKAIGQLIGKYFPETTIIYTRARQVSDFRHKFNLLKVRDINKYHHVHDAYLNIVVGNYYHEHFKVKRFTKDTARYEYNAKNLFEISLGNYWNKEKHLPIVFSIFNRKNILVTRQPFINKGEFYDQNLSKASGANRAPIKESGPIKDTSKYGGYSGNNTSHFALVEIEVRQNKVERRFVPISVYAANRMSDVDLEGHLKTLLGRENIKVIKKVVPLHTVIEVNGSVQYLAGINSLTQLHVQNLIEPFFDPSNVKYFDLLQKAQTLFNANEHLLLLNINEFAVLPTREREGTITKKLNLQFFDYIIAQFEKPIYSNVFPTANVATNLQENRETFIEFPLKKQTKVLIDLVSLLQTGPLRKVDLRELGLNASINRNVISNLVKANSRIIKTSLTGFQVKKVKISK